jgi:hypothetical protein
MRYKKPCGSVFNIALSTPPLSGLTVIQDNCCYKAFTLKFRLLSISFTSARSDDERYGDVSTTTPCSSTGGILVAGRNAVGEQFGFQIESPDLRDHTVVGLWFLHVHDVSPVLVFGCVSE